MGVVLSKPAANQHEVWSLVNQNGQVMGKVASVTVGPIDKRKVCVMVQANAYLTSDGALSLPYLTGIVV